MKPNDMGGPAFPMPYSTDEHSSECNITTAHDGMTLWDWYAAHADSLHEEMSASGAYELAGIKQPNGIPTITEQMEVWAKANARFKAMQADAMLAERAKRVGGEG